MNQIPLNFFQQLQNNQIFQAANNVMKFPSPLQKNKYLAIVEIFTYKKYVIISKNVSQKIFIYSSQYYCCLKKKYKSLHMSYHSKIKLQFAIIKSSRCSPSLVVFSTRRYKMRKKKKSDEFSSHIEG